jgi:hypothetical protein
MDLLPKPRWRFSGVVLHVKVKYNNRNKGLFSKKFYDATVEDPNAFLQLTLSKKILKGV